MTTVIVNLLLVSLSILNDTFLPHAISHYLAMTARQEMHSGSENQRTTDDTVFL